MIVVLGQAWGLGNEILAVQQRLVINSDVDSVSHSWLMGGGSCVLLERGHLRAWSQAQYQSELRLQDRDHC
jgi:hypothetical protein